MTARCLAEADSGATARAGHAAGAAARVVADDVGAAAQFTED
jgi:hypothetical protein